MKWLVHRSEVGQLLLYLLGAHARQLRTQSGRPQPILGIFIDGDMVSMLAM